MQVVMDKSPEAFRTISEVAETLDVPPHVLRFWESRFAQVKPVKRGGGRRYYRPEDVRLLRGIRGLLYDDGITIKGVQKILRERGVRHVIGLGTLADGEPAPALAPVAAPRRAAPRPAGKPARKPAPRAVSNGRAGPPAAPQADLFAAKGEERAGGARATDRKALRALVAKLESLRAVMIDDPES
jgi:DNA-binding transcriptional MerR regulator